MTGHAKRYIWNLGFRPLIDPDVTSRALQSVRQMHLVGICDWLFRMLRMQVKEIIKGADYC
jgi:hypothetical protein